MPDWLKPLGSFLDILQPRQCGGHRKDASSRRCSEKCSFVAAQHCSIRCVCPCAITRAGYLNKNIRSLHPGRVVQDETVAHTTRFADSQCSTRNSFEASPDCRACSAREIRDTIALHSFCTTSCTQHRMQNAHTHTKVSPNWDWDTPLQHAKPKWMAPNELPFETPNRVP